MKLDTGSKHLMRLIRRDAVDGWTSCSTFVAPLLASIPQELIEIDATGEKIRVRLTPAGNNVLDVMEYL